MIGFPVTYYYRLLQEICVIISWKEWIIFILEGLEEVANKTPI